MNHNYYYILLSKRAQGQVQAGCTATSKWLRYLQETNGTYIGSVDTQANAPYSLAFGGSVEVWADDWSGFGNGAELWLDEAKTQAFRSADPSQWFSLEGALFYYNNILFTQNYQAAVPVITQTLMDVGDTNICNLSGPFPNPIWADQDNWQLVTRVWSDQALTQPFPGGDLWYSVDPNGPVNAMGTTIQINNCGQIIGLYAC